MISFSTYDIQKDNAKFGTRFPLPLSPFPKLMWERVPQPQAGKQSWKGYGKQSVVWSKRKTGRDASTRCDSQALYTHRGTHTAVGRKIAFGMLKAANVCLSSLILLKALLLSSLLLQCCCSLPLFFFCPSCSCKYPTKGGGKGSQKVVTASPSSVDLGLPSVFLFHQPHVSMRVCIPRAVFASKLRGIKESSQGNLLVRACWEENSKQRMMYCI